jgi:uncharacterized protein
VALTSELQGILDAIRDGAYGSALLRLRGLADGTGPDALRYELLLRHLDGETEPALGWARLAADLGDDRNQYLLGSYHLEGSHFVEKNHVEAAKWFALAAASGNAEAQVALGEMHSLGVGVEKDLAGAALWYLSAAAQGNAAAQRNIGEMHEHGLGVRLSRETAIQWYRLAAEQGDAFAQHLLATTYDSGSPADLMKAFRWQRLAAQQGLACAQSALGALYERGLGVRRDLSKAYYWYDLAAQQDDEDGMVAVENLQRVMTSAEIALAKEMEDQE